jgi:hypothetical protein
MSADDLELDAGTRLDPDSLAWMDGLRCSGAEHGQALARLHNLLLRAARSEADHPVLIDAGFADLETTIPWWGNRTLRFRFPPR